MSEWGKVPFVELFSIPSRNGLTRPSAVRGSGYKMINMGELFANDRIGNIPMERVKMNERELATMLVQKDDLLFARQSLVLSGAGRCVIVNEVTEPTTFESHLIRIRLDESKADPRFYRYYFMSPFSAMKSIVKQGVQAGIKGSDLQKLMVHCPPLPLQRRIADILSAYDDLIENNRRRIAILKETARTLYRKMFGRDGTSGTDGTNGTVGDICEEIRRGVSPDEIDPKTPYIGLEHMPRRSISLSEWDSAQKVTSTKLVFHEGEILFGKIRPYFHKVGIAFVDGVASSDAIVIRPLKPALRAYVLSVVSSDAFVAVASQGMKEGSKMPRADWKQLLKYPVSIPTKEELSRFNAVVEPVLAQLKALCFANRNLAAARDLLLPRLMSGRLRVDAAAGRGKREVA